MLMPGGGGQSGKVVSVSYPALAGDNQKYDKKGVPPHPARKEQHMACVLHALIFFYYYFFSNCWLAARLKAFKTGAVDCK